MTSHHKLRLVSSLSGHADRAWHVTWNPKRPLLASCSSDKSVRVFSYSYQGDKASGDDSIVFRHTSTIPTGHSKSVRALAWSPSGKTLVTASFDSNIGIWEQENDSDQDEHDGEAKGEWECISQLEGHETECKSVAYSSDGSLLASCSRDKTVWIWEVHPDADFECMGVLMDHSQDVKAVAWHPTEEILASASYDDTIKLYIDDPSDDWFSFSTLTGHTSTVWSIAFSPCGRYLASGSDDKSIRIWKRFLDSSGGGGMEGTVGRWESVLILEGHERSVYSVSWGAGPASGSRDGDENLGWIASTGSDGSIRVWELTVDKAKSSPNHQLIAHVESAHGVYDINSISWCPRAGYTNLLATVADDGSIRVWRLGV